MKAVVHGKWRGEAVFLTIATAVGGFLRFYRIGKECLWFDEIATAVRVHSSFLGLTDTLTKTILFPPLYYYMVKLWAFTAGTTPADLRSFSALWGTAAIPIIYLLAREMFGRKAAVVSTILLVFSAFNIYYSQEAKMYAMWWTLVLASNLFFVRAVKYGGRRSDLRPYVLVTAAALWTHNFTVLVILSQVIYLAAVLKPRAMAGRWVLAYLLVLILYLPWLLTLLAVKLAASGGVGAEGAIVLTRSAIDWIPVPPLRDFILAFVNFSSGLQFYAYDIDTWAFSWHVPFQRASSLCLLAMALLLYPVLRGKPGEFGFKRFIIILILFPSLLLFLYSRFIMPLWQLRYIGFIAPLLFVVLGYGYELSSRKGIASAALCVMLFLNLSILDFYYTDRVKKPWDELVAYLTPRVGDGARIIFLHNFSLRSFEFHWNLDRQRRRMRRRMKLELPPAGGGETLGNVAGLKDLKPAITEKGKPRDRSEIHYDSLKETVLFARSVALEDPDAWLVLSYSLPRSKKLPPDCRVDVPGYRQDKMYFGNGLEVVRYLREQAE